MHASLLLAFRHSQHRPYYNVLCIQWNYLWGACNYQARTSPQFYYWTVQSQSLLVSSSSTILPLQTRLQCIMHFNVCHLCCSTIWLKGNRFLNWLPKGQEQHCLPKSMDKLGNSFTVNKIADGIEKVVLCDISMPEPSSGRHQISAVSCCCTSDVSTTSQRLGILFLLLRSALLQTVMGGM